MGNPKVFAYRHSQELDGKRKNQEEVEIIDRKNENGTTTYVVKTSDGIYCSAIYNIFADAFFADDVYGVIENYRPKRDMEM